MGAKLSLVNVKVNLQSLMDNLSISFSSFQGGQVGLYDRAYTGVDRGGAVLMGTGRHDELILSNAIHPHGLDETTVSIP